MTADARETAVRYRKKPVQVYAIQNMGEWAPIMAWLDEVGGGHFTIPFGTQPPVQREPDGTLKVYTLHGWTKASVGDWVICGPRGDFWPCDPDVFRDTYEAVEDSGA